MITKWKVFNFKSVRKETELEFAPLTIFAGANSSGKSTFLQSILLVAQTLDNRVDSRSIILNGSLARLGQFDDIFSRQAESEQIVLGFECEPVNQEVELRYGGETSLRLAPIYFSDSEMKISQVGCEFAFDADPSSPQRDILQLQPRLFSSSLKVTMSDSEGNSESIPSIFVTNAAVSGETSTSRARELEVAESLSEYAGRSLEQYVTIDDRSLDEIRARFQSAQLVGCLMQHFLPDRLSLRIDRTFEDSVFVASVLCDFSERYFSVWRAPTRAERITVPAGVLQDLQNAIRSALAGLGEESIWAENLLAKTEAESSQLTVWLERLRSLRSDQRRSLTMLLSRDPELRDRLSEKYRAHYPTAFEIVPHRLPDNLRMGVDYLERFFGRNFKYLGPLRDEPKAMYPLAHVQDPFDVGLRGENTAAVLELNKSTIIQYVPARCFEGKTTSCEPVPKTLDAAVVDWLQYLGVASSVKSKDQGKFGHELKVRIGDEAQLEDLTHVGVGVSQVLPILVMSLLAKADSTLIFEQPELHLHPKVQTRLGDFFLSMIALNKQCIVETHSEYLINRLRLRTAAAEGEAKWLERIRVYFVQRSEEGSTFRDVRINEYGAILDWPEGFFDQSQDEAEAILRAAARKRKQKRGK